MATNWIYYPQSPKVADATLDEDIGTSSTLENVINSRKLSLMEVDTVTAGQFRFQIDLGSGKTLQPDFLAFVNNNLYSAAAATLGLTYSSSDTLSGTSPGGTPTDTFTPFAPTAAQEEILVKTWTPSPSKRYWWVDLTSTDNTANIGQLLLGVSLEPVVDPSWEQPIEIDIESGRIVNMSEGGFNWKTRKHAKRRGFVVKYELISDSDLSVLRSLTDGDDYIDSQFVFTNDGGTSYYYGEISGNPIWTPMQQGLHNYEFTILEVIG